ncbi:MAG: type II secretion system F family protein [Candidatus Omnitrophica bacterium]|nr:type II secretion system F family protein [Candidatus Omnitrophota bacterium]
MPIYKYTAKSQPGETIHAKIEAESLRDAVNKIAKDGYFPISVEPESSEQEKKAFFNFSKPNSNDILLFTTQLSSLTESGINILKGLNIVSEQTTNKYLKNVLIEMISQIKDGKPLSEALSQYPKLFPSFYVSMVRSGEIGGTLELSLKRIANYMEKEQDFKNSLRTALSYPIFVIIVGMATIAVLLGFVIPRLIIMFEDMGQALPLPTKILIDLSGFLRSWWWLMLLLMGIAVFLLRRLQTNSDLRLSFDKFKLKLAVIGEIILKTELGRLMRTLSLLLSNGISIIYSLDISATILQNEVLRAELKKIREKLGSGASLSQAVKDSKLFPAVIVNIISIGEEIGDLEKSFQRIAEDYEKDVDRRLKIISRLLEPAIITVMGLIVGFIVLSMLLPIFQINLIAR